LKELNIKLYNKTKCPNKILEPLLIAAGKSVGARTSNVVVKVTQGHSISIRGRAHAGFPYLWHLRNLKCRRNPKRFGTGEPPLGKLVQTDGGWFEITLPKLTSIVRINTKYDRVDCASSFYKVAQHEWGHIRDYQQGTMTRSHRTPSGRRIRHDDRIEEIRANSYVENAKKISNADDLILDLALWLEESNG